MQCYQSFVVPALKQVLKATPDNIPLAVSTFAGRKVSQPNTQNVGVLWRTTYIILSRALPLATDKNVDLNWITLFWGLDQMLNFQAWTSSRLSTAESHPGRNIRLLRLRFKLSRSALNSCGRVP